MRLDLPWLHIVIEFDYHQIVVGGRALPRRGLAWIYIGPVRVVLYFGPMLHWDAV